MTALAGGLIALVIGIIGLIFWWPYFLKALMAGVPAMLILGGALAAYLGIEEIKDKKASESSDMDTTNLKSEVESLLSIWIQKVEPGCSQDSMIIP